MTPERAAGTFCTVPSPRMHATWFDGAPSGALLAVDTPGVVDPEYQARVAKGFWSPWMRAPGGRLEVSHPRLGLPGVHAVEVRARDAAAPEGMSNPVELRVVGQLRPQR